MPETATVETPLQAQLRASFRRNASFIVGWEVIWALGAGCCMVWTVVPAYLLGIGASKALEQTVMVGFQVAALLQLLASRLSHGHHRKGKIFLVWCLFCLAWMGYGLAALLWWDFLSRGVFMGLFIGACVVMMATINLGDPSFNELMLENTPLQRRGRLSALRMAALGVFGIPGVLLAVWIMGRWPAFANFHYSFVIGGGLMLLSCLTILGVRDHAQAAVDPAAPRPSVRKHLRRLLGDRPFCAFLGCVAIQRAAFSLIPLLIAYGQDEAGIGADQVSWFTAAQFAGPILVGFFLLPFADRFGFRLIGLLCCLFSVVAFGLVMLSGPRPVPLLIAYTILAGTNIALSLVLVNLGCELVPAVKPVILLAVASLLVMPLSALAGPLAGHLIDRFGPPAYTGILLAGAILSLIALVGFKAYVREPRQTETPYVPVRTR